MPVEPPRTEWALPDARRPLLGEVVGIGADLAPGTLLAGYRRGIFPMRLEGLSGPLAWWSPNPRGVLPLDGLRVSRSLRKSCRRFTVTVDAAFDRVVQGCADERRDARWITDEMQRAYGTLHRLGWAHSVEVWCPDGSLAGGLYGVAIGGLFAGESMFHVERDASKVALVHLVDLLTSDGLPGRLLDVQWSTAHLSSLGAVGVSRRRYLALLAKALRLPLPAAFAG